MFLIMLEKLMKEHGLNPNQLSKQSGIPYMTIKNFWDKGYNGIRLSTLRQLANFFNVSLDYLVLGTETKTDLDSSYEMLNSEGKKKVKEYINDLTENPKYLKDEQKEINVQVKREPFSGPRPAQIAAYGHGVTGVDQD